MSKRNEYPCSICGILYQETTLRDQCQSQPVPNPKYPIGSKVKGKAEFWYFVREITVSSTYLAPRMRQHILKYTLQRVDTRRKTDRFLVVAESKIDLWMWRHEHTYRKKVNLDVHFNGATKVIILNLKRMPFIRNSIPKKITYEFHFFIIADGTHVSLCNPSVKLSWKSIENKLRLILKVALQGIPPGLLDSTLEKIHQELIKFDRKEVNGGRPSIFE